MWREVFKSLAGATVAGSIASRWRRPAGALGDFARNASRSPPGRGRSSPPTPTREDLQVPVDDVDEEACETFSRIVRYEDSVCLSGEQWRSASVTLDVDGSGAIPICDATIRSSYNTTALTPVT